MWLAGLWWAVLSPWLRISARLGMAPWLLVSARLLISTRLLVSAWLLISPRLLVVRGGLRLRLVRSKISFVLISPRLALLVVLARGGVLLGAIVIAAWVHLRYNQQALAIRARSLLSAEGTVDFNQSIAGRAGELNRWHDVFGRDVRSIRGSERGHSIGLRELGQSTRNREWEIYTKRSTSVIDALPQVKRTVGFEI